MSDRHTRRRLRLSFWVVILLTGLVVVAGAGLFWIEDGFPLPPKTAVGWVLFVLTVLLMYLLLEGIADGGAEGLRSDTRIFIRAIPVVIVVLLYVFWYWTR